MDNLIGNAMGAVHLGSSICALVFGTIVLLKRKGTKLHKIVGYLYLVTMMAVLTTAFMIYRLYGRFGIFHVAAILSSITLLAGIVPVWFKGKSSNWPFFHAIFMYWSVLGLYMALAAEILTRIPNSNFVIMVVISMAIIMLLGFYNFKSFYKKSLHGH